MSEIVEGFGVSIDGAKNDVTPVALESDSGMNAGSVQGYVVSEDDSTDEYGAVAAHRVVEVDELVGSPVTVSHFPLEGLGCFGCKLRCLNMLNERVCVVKDPVRACRTAVYNIQLYM